MGYLRLSGGSDVFVHAQASKRQMHFTAAQWYRQTEGPYLRCCVSAPGRQSPGDPKVKLTRTLPESARTPAPQSQTPCQTLERPRPRGLWATPVSRE